MSTSGALTPANPLCLDLRFGQGLHLAGDEDHFLDAKAGVHRLKLLAEELRQVLTIACGLGRADAQTCAFLINAAHDQVQPADALTAPHELSTKIVGEPPHDVLQRLELPIGSAKARVASAVSSGISGLIGSKAWPMAWSRRRAAS
jgi:hypothetical protein